jgi:hypothetical protein
MFAVSRIIAAVARQHLLPPFLAKVHKRFGTPYISTALSGVATAVIALFTSFDELLNMVSNGQQQQQQLLLTRTRLCLLLLLLSAALLCRVSCYNYAGY